MPADVRGIAAHLTAKYIHDAYGPDGNSLNGVSEGAGAGASGTLGARVLGHTPPMGVSPDAQTCRPSCRQHGAHERARGFLFKVSLSQDQSLACAHRIVLLIAANVPSSRRQPPSYQTGAMTAHGLSTTHNRSTVSCSTWQSPRRPQVVQSALQGPRGS